MIQTALLNTVLGMGVVFCALIFISIVIGLLKYINQMQNQNVENSVPVIKPPVPDLDRQREAAAVKKAEEDAELVAAIAAAISAYQGEVGIETPTDGLVVRSIKKRGIIKL